MVRAPVPARLAVRRRRRKTSKIRRLDLHVSQLLDIVASSAWLRPAFSSIPTVFHVRVFPQVVIRTEPVHIEHESSLCSSSQAGTSITTHTSNNANMPAVPPQWLPNRSAADPIAQISPLTAERSFPFRCGRQCSPDALQGLTQSSAWHICRPAKNCGKRAQISF